MGARRTQTNNQGRVLALRNGHTDGRTDGQTLLQRCEDASKNDQGWLVSDWRWIRGIFELGYTDGRTDGQTLLQRCEDASKKNEAGYTERQLRTVGQGQ